MIGIRTFHPADAAAVRDLFSQGLLDFASDETYGVYDMGFEAPMREYIRHSLADDLADISASYLKEPGGHFWVAESEGSDETYGVYDRIKGMVGIQRRTDEEAELRRMSVASDSRRHGIGSRLLETAEAFCREQGYLRIRLTTVSLLQPAIALYRKHGYQQVGEERYGQITGLHFVKRLTD
jgi:GNAT superfamily N-acetyltransferase